MSKAKLIDPPEVIKLLQIIADLYATVDGFDGVIIRNDGAKYSSKNDFYSGGPAHQLSPLYNKFGDKVFHSVIVVTDRTVLDDQLQDTIYQSRDHSHQACADQKPTPQHLHSCNWSECQKHHQHSH